MSFFINFSFIQNTLYSEETALSSKRGDTLAAQKQSQKPVSTFDQLGRIIEKYWSDVDEYVLLKLESSKLPGELVFEANPGSTNKYYHLYHGSIPFNAIVEVDVKKAPR